MNFLPAVKCICPSCFEEIYLGECRIMSGRTPGRPLRTPPKGWRSRMRAEPLEGREFTLELAQRECPSCKYLLPSNIELVPSIILVVVGDTFSGKSHYIASLIHQIKADWIGNATGFARFTCLTPDVERIYTQDYFEPVFVYKQVLPATGHQFVQVVNGRITIKPLIYKLSVSPSPRHPAKTVNLMIYDTGGEDYEDMNRLVEFAQFFLNTNAFVFVANPITMDPLVAQLDPALQVALESQIRMAKAKVRRTADGFNVVMDIFEKFHRVSDGARLSNTPIAVMLSKADLLKYSNPRSYYHFLSNPQYGGSVDLQDLQTVDQEVRNLLIQYRQNDLLTATNRFGKVKFFATSATGEPPDGSGNLTNVAPLRCLDPLLWILHQLEIIGKQ